MFPLLEHNRNSFLIFIFDCSFSKINRLGDDAACSEARDFRLTCRSMANTQKLLHLGVIHLRKLLHSATQQPVVRLFISSIYESLILIVLSIS